MDLDGQARRVDEHGVEILEDLVGVFFVRDVNEGVRAEETDCLKRGDVLDLHSEKSFRNITGRTQANKKRSRTHFFFFFFFFLND